MSPDDQKLVFYRLDKMDGHLVTIAQKLDNIIEHQHKLDKRQALAEVKSGLFGSLGGFVSVSLVLFKEWFRKHT